MQYHLQISSRLLINAREELAKGHRRQAGEKAWGAVVQPIKAIAEQRGWPHQSQLWRLRRLTGNGTLEIGDTSPVGFSRKPASA